MTGISPKQIADQLSLPVIVAPMFLVSSPEMVIESCKAGLIGSFPLLNARSKATLEEWLKRVKEEIAEARIQHPHKKIAPWAVNIIVHRSNTRFDEDLELVKRYEPPIVITSLGNPESIVHIVHGYGGLVFADVATLSHARKAAQTHVDGLILVCHGAGGHAGTLNPFAFMGAVREFWDGLTVLAGCMSSGKDIYAAQVLSADLAYMGTRFIATTESLASTSYQKMLIESTAEDLMNTDSFTGIHANYLLPSIRNGGLDPNNLQQKGQLDVSRMDQSKAKVWKDIWSAGQGVGLIKQISPISKVAEELKREYEQTHLQTQHKNGPNH